MKNCRERINQMMTTIENRAGQTVTWPWMPYNKSGSSVEESAKWLHRNFARPG
jgi:hypothetical protein